MPDTSQRYDFGFQFSVLSRLWRRTLEQQLAARGICDISWLPLIHLYRGGDNVSQKTLATRVGMDSSTLVRLIDRMVEQGHAERCPAPGDRRTRLIRLTPAGWQQAEYLASILREIEDRMLADLTDADIRQIMGSLDRLHGRLLQLHDQGAK